MKLQCFVSGQRSLCISTASLSTTETFEFNAINHGRRPAAKSSSGLQSTPEVAVI